MSLRFRRTVKIGGVRFNVGKTGISTSLGGRGASINFGKRGVYSNIGIPGSGVSFRSRIGETNVQESSVPRISSQGNNSSQMSQQRVQFVLDDETGESHFTDSEGQLLPEKWIQAAKKQNRELIVAMLDNECKKYNDKLNSLLNIHLETPPSDTLISYSPILFEKMKPIPPEEKEYIIQKPVDRKPKNRNLFTRNVGFLGKKLANENLKIEYENQENKKRWQEKQELLSNKYKEDLIKYQTECEDWKREKEEFEKEQSRIMYFVDVARKKEIEAMKDFLEEHLDALVWPLETKISFDVTDNGTRVRLDVDLPEIEMMPIKNAKVNHNKLNLTINELSKSLQQQNYLTHIHSIGFRIIGETFVALPTVEEIVLSGYSQRTDPKTGQIVDDYLYSVKVPRMEWEKINFSRLDSIKVVDCFESFNLLRNLTKQFEIRPIEPFSV
jgi:hypothetical protein